MERQPLVALMRFGIIIALGTATGCMMVLSSTAFSAFALVTVPLPMLYVFMTLTGAILSFLYHEISHIALASVGSVILAVACLGSALGFALRAVGWIITVDVLLTMVGVHLVSYSFTMLIFQAIGAFVILMVRRV